MPSKKKKDEVVDSVVYEKKSKANISSMKNEVVEDVVIETKPYFFPRLVAYVIDVFLISIVCSGIMFLLPQNENYDKYMKEYEQIQTEAIEGEIELEEFFHKSASISYDIDYSNVFPMIIEITLIILYFVVFQFYNKGQTLGKKLMKLRVVSTNGNDLTINQVAYRALIIDSILINILIIGSLLFLGRDYYFYASYVLQLIAGAIIFITLMMILFRKDGKGLHDVIADTKVIQEN